MILIHELTPNIIFSGIYTSKYLFFSYILQKKSFYLSCTSPHFPHKEKFKSIEVKVYLQVEGGGTLFYKVKRIKQVD